MSMANELVAKRYSSALFEHAKEKGTLAEVEADIRTIMTIFEKTPQLQTFLIHPKITPAEKKRVLSESLHQTVSAVVLNTLCLMIDRKRGDSILEMANQFKILSMEERQIAEAVVYSVKPLTDDETKAISDLFSKKVGKQALEINHVIDDELIGGIKIRIGNKIYDGSISGKLERIKRELVV